MTNIFPERGKIDKAQFILDRSALVLKKCKIPSAKCCDFQFTILEGCTCVLLSYKEFCNSN